MPCLCIWGQLRIKCYNISNLSLHLKFNMVATMSLTQINLEEQTIKTEVKVWMYNNQMT